MAMMMVMIMMMMMMMMMMKMMIMLILMLMLMLSRIAFFNTVSKEKYEEVHPKQSALATAHHGMCLSVFTQSISVVLQVVQHCLASSYRLFNTVSHLHAGCTTKLQPNSSTLLHQTNSSTGCTA